MAGTEGAIEPRLTQVEPFIVSGISVRTRNSAEANPATARIAGLWKRFAADDIPATVPGRLGTLPVYGVYSDYESDASGEFTVTAGVAVSAPAPGLDSVDVAGGRYLVFEATGEMPRVVVETWARVWTHFEQSTAHTRRFDTDFELNAGPTEVAIHVGIE